MSSNLITRSVFVPHAEVAQAVEHSTENARVPSSSLGFGILKGDRLRAGQRSLEPPIGVRIPVPLCLVQAVLQPSMAIIAQLAERLIVVQVVVGSSPIGRP